MSKAVAGKRPAVVRDVMIPLSEHPHVPYWLTIRQAMVVLREIALEQERARYYEPTLLVFDQEYNLLGIVRRRHLLAAVEPRLTDPEAFDVAMLPVMEGDQVLGVVRWTDLFNEMLGGLLEQ